jgi:hypothetical protein
VPSPCEIVEYHDDKHTGWRHYYIIMVFYNYTGWRHY